MPAFLWIASVFAAFRRKAFTIDDPFFLAQARQVLAHPFDPSGFDIVWGTQVGRASEVSPTGPGMAYLLTPTVALGGSEWVAHLTVFAFLALGAGSLAALAQRLGARPAEARLGALALATTPVVLAMAGTAMPDVPAMAVALVAMERTLAFRSEPRAALGIAVAGLFALAILIRSHAVMLLPVAALFCVGDALRGRGNQPRRDAGVPWPRLWPLALALFLALGSAWLTRDAATGVVNFATSAAYLEPRALAHHVTGFFFHFLLALPFALAWSVLHFRRLAWRLFLAIAVILALSLAAGRSWAAPFAAFAAVALWDALRSTWRSGDTDRLALVLWLFAALPVVMYVHLPSKYLTLSAPAAVLLLIFESRSCSPRTRRWLWTGWVIGGAVLGVAILRADARLAAVGREAAATLVAPRTAAGERVWYAGSWGLHWYAEAAGARPLLAAGPGEPAPGEYIVYSSFRSGALREPHYGARVDRVGDSGPGGRVMDRDAGAGFYSVDFGYLPWSFATGIVDQFELWRVASPPSDDEAEPGARIRSLRSDAAR